MVKKSAAAARRAGLILCGLAAMPLSPALGDVPTPGIAPVVVPGQVNPERPAALPAWQPLGEPSVGGRVTSISVSPHDARRVLMGGDMLGVGLSVDQGETWRSTSGFRSWEIGDITWHPDDPQRVWAGTMGGPYLSEDGGRTWRARRAGLPGLESFDFSAPIEKVLFDPNDPQRLLAAGGTSRRWRVTQVDGALGAVWESLDGGGSWSRLSTLTATGSTTDPDAAGINIVSMAFAAASSTRLYATVDEQGFYRSDDGGQTWVKRNATLPGTNVERVLAHPVLPDTVFVTLSNAGTAPGGVYRSDDGGDTFTDANGGLDQVSGSNSGNTSRYKGVAIDGLTGGRLVASDDRFGSAGIFLTDDGGTSWSNVLGRFDLPLPYPSRTEMEVATIAPSEPDVMFLAGSANLVRSIDGGQTWNDAANVELSEGVFRGRGYSGLVATEITFNRWRRGQLVVQGFDGARVMQSLDGGQAWTFEANQTGSFGGGADAVFASADVGYASMGFPGKYQGIGRTFDGGQTWDVVVGSARGLPDEDANVRAGAIHASASNPQHVWSVIGGDVYRSLDGGDSWTVVQSGIGDGWFAATPDDAQLYVSGSAGTWRSDDGQTFVFIGGPARNGKLAMGADGTLWHAAHDRTGNPGLGLWTYTPEAGWQSVLTPDDVDDPFVAQYLVGVALSPDDPDVIAVTTADPPFRDQSRGRGVFLSDDGGQTWRALNHDLPMLRGAAIAFDPFDGRRLLLGTAGRGFFSLRLPQRRIAPAVP
ncbi:MAG: hypothetical protein AAFU65_01970 [Pseudomonadota bacterium]